MRFSEPRVNDTTVQCEFYRRARNRGLDVYVEYASHAPSDADPDVFYRRKRSGRVASCRFDVVVVDANEVIAIIECKSIPVDPSCGISLQRKRYASYDVPFFVVTGLDEIDAVIDSLLEMLDN